MTQTEVIGKWFSIERDGKTYNVLIQGTDVSSIIVMDDDFNKIPYKEWDDFEKIIESFGLTVDVVVCYKDGIPKGFMTLKQYMNTSVSSWWDSVKQIEISKIDWDEDRVHIGNIKKYVDLYECR